VRTEAQISVLASRPSIRSPRDLERGHGGDLANAVICGVGSGLSARQPLATSAMASSDPMLAWCELQEPCQLQVARFNARFWRLLRQSIELHAVAPSLARLRAACNADAPQ
jgi:hypothetical protein